MLGARAGTRATDAEESRSSEVTCPPTYFLWSGRGMLDYGWTWAGGRAAGVGG